MQPSGLGRGLAMRSQQQQQQQQQFQSTNSTTSTRSTQPLGIQNYRAGKSSGGKFGGPVVAASLPTSFLDGLPMAPRTKPRTSVIEPPPMELPPSPPVYSPMMQANATNAGKPSSRSNNQFSRSLSNNPPVNFLSASPQAEDIESEEKDLGHKKSERTTREDDDLPVGRLGGEYEQANQAPQLSRSPTVFSVLSGKQDFPASMPAKSTNSILYQMSSNEQDSPPSPSKDRAQQIDTRSKNATDVTAGEDLQFDINLDDNDENDRENI